MDTDLKKKDAEGASSDEEEAFESADEGEEGVKSSKPPLATSAGNESSNSTSKEPVGNNDRSKKTPVSLGDDTSSKTAELENQPSKMDQNVAQEKTGQETQGGDAPCRVPDENSPCSDEIGPDTEVCHKTLVEEHADNLSSNVSEDETKTTECKGDSDEEKSDTIEADKNEDDRGQDKSTASLIESGVEENTEMKDNDEQKQTFGNVDKEPLKDGVKSTDSDKDVKPDR